MGRPAAGIRLGHLASDFLGDLERAGKSPHTIRGYRSDLAAFRRHYTGPPEDIDPGVLRGYLQTLADKSPATRARHEASLASFLAWAYRNSEIPSDPMTRLDRIKLPDPGPRGLPAAAIEAIFAAIPKNKDRDRLLFRFIYLTGARVAEALAVHVEDLDLTPDDEHVTVTGKGGRRRTILLDDRPFTAELRRYLRTRGYRHGPLFRAAKNGTGGPLRYQSVHELWQKYAATADVTAAIHQLRHSHATELVNDGVSLQIIRKRLGHRNLQTTLRYAEQSDITADNELRARQRRRAAG